MHSLFCRFAQNGNVQLDINSPQITSQLKHVLAGWCTDELPHDLKIELHATFHVVHQLPSLPTSPPSFVDTRIRSEDDIANLSVYHIDHERYILSFYECAYAKIDLTQRPLNVELFILDQFVDNVVFEDVLFVTLAAPLRRLGIFLAHAFAVTPSDGKSAILLVGPSHSGKTTTGLNLLLNQWRLLSNDIVVLQRDGTGIYAHPTPNLFTIRPQTFSLLPELQRLLPEIPDDSVYFSSDQLINGNWGEPSFVRAIFFPHISNQLQSSIETMSAALSMSTLLEESFDTWDEASVTSHVQMLADLSLQANCFKLVLGSDMKEISQLIASYSSIQ